MDGNNKPQESSAQELISDFVLIEDYVAGGDRPFGKKELLMMIDSGSIDTTDPDRMKVTL